MRGKKAKQLRKLAQKNTEKPRLERGYSEHAYATTMDGWKRADKLHANVLLKLKEFLGKKFKIQNGLAVTFRWVGPKRTYRDLKKAYVRGTYRRGMII